MKFKPIEEWNTQAAYDLETAKAMIDSGRYIYAVFMCHLALEKTLKGLWALVFSENAPKTHNLEYLLKNLNLQVPGNISNLIFEIDEVSIPTRYPEDLSNLLSYYPKDKTVDLYNNTKNTIQWLKTLK